MTNFNLLAKIAGGVTAGLVLYSTHKTAKRISAEHVKTCAADRMTKHYMESRRADNRGPVTSGLKDWVFKENASMNLPDTFNAVTGYCKGAFQQLASNIVPAALATGALLGKGLSKFFGAGLLVYGVKYLLCDVLGIGRINNLK